MLTNMNPARACELNNGPFDTIGCPDPDAIARFKIQRKQSRGKTIGAIPQFGPGEAPALVHRHHRLRRWPHFGGVMQKSPIVSSRSGGVAAPTT
jgi:hypothetical protein